ncbi:UPF0692 protein CG33108 [Aricia agestis]|uniref:UPF0692 protein CG33108 n=1 Tax=Aricia agestis TaxID=91739 RepID=UPI001C20B078|nr:UPF0692 protein CG33108 [Aricia agestis]
MCTTPPAPPPPPPPPPLPTQVSPSPKPISSSGDITPPSTTLDVCQWALSEPQLREVCSRNNICLDVKPYLYKYKDFKPIIQVGPTCGLVALSMLLNGAVTSDELFNITKMEGFSNNGEMFSCNNMAKLADKAISLAEFDNVRFHVKEGGLFSEDTVIDLLNGAALLVAYDADCNHAPCERKGHTAHWALICGVIIVSEVSEGEYTSDPNNVYVLSRHGKSKYLSAWKLDALAKSNQNLWEFSPKKKEDGMLYVLPEGGIGGKDGLRDQFLIFYGL